MSLRTTVGSEAISRLLRRLWLLAMTGIFLVTPISSSLAQVRFLESVRDDVTEYYEMDDGEKKVITRPGRHYYVRFDAEDHFEFVVPQNYMGVKNHPWFREGTTLYIYIPEDPDEIEVPYRLSNRLVKMRNGFVAGEKYFLEQAEKAGLKATFWKPMDVPIEVIIGQPTGANAAAEAAFWDHQIVMKPSMSMDLHVVAVHEYFHFFSDAIWFTGDKKDFWKRYGTNSTDPYLLFLNEMGAEWSTDEPIQVEKVNFGTKNLDDVNHYINVRAAHGFFPNNEKAFFEQDEYDSNIFFKYLAEQIKGNKDESAAPEMLKLIYDIFQKGGANKDTFFKAVVEKLPAHFRGKSWEKTWMNFMTRFHTANVVQTAKAMKKPTDRMGYNDPGVNNKNAWHGNKIAKTWDREFSKPSTKVYRLPAKTDTERKKRLEELLGEDELVQAMAYKLHQIHIGGFNKSDAPSRPVYFFARGVDGTNAFLLRQKVPHDETWPGRNKSKFERISEFTFSDSTSPSPRSLGVIEEYDNQNYEQHIWLGLSNPGHKQHSRVIAWSYIASPRILEAVYIGQGEPSKTVRLMRGDAYTRRLFTPSEAFFNGDKFTIEIKTTGPLHAEGVNLKDIKPKDFSGELKILTDTDAEVDLEDVHNGQKFKIVCSRTPEKYADYYMYEISGHISEHNAHLGDARMKLKITSPLNLGGNDEEIDETYTFKLKRKHPYLDRFVLKLGKKKDAEVIYDNYTNTRNVPDREGENYQFYVEATFNMPMKEHTVEILAGPKEPYNQYGVKKIKCKKKDTLCTGRITIPKDAIDPGGTLIRFAVNGKSKREGVLDANPLEEGVQPNTAHYIVLGIKEFYEYSSSAEAHESYTGGHLNLFSDAGPLRFSTHLMPYRLSHDGYNNVYVEHFQNALDATEKTKQDLQKSIQEMEADYEAFKKNPKKKTKAILKEKQKQLKGMKRGLKQKQTQQFINQTPDGKRNYEMMMQRLEKSIQDQKKNKDLHKELLKYKRDNLQDQKRRFAFIESRFIPLMEAAVRLMHGYKRFRFKEEFEPAAGSFDGFRVWWSTEEGGGSENYQDYQSAGREINFRQGRSTGYGWAANDIRELEGTWAKDWMKPEIEVWDYWKSDIEKVRTLMNLKFPDYMTKDMPEPPTGSPVHDSIRFMHQSTQLRVQSKAIQARRLLTDTARLMWDFFPEKDRPDVDFSKAINDDGTVKQEALVLPTPKTNRLIKVARHFNSRTGFGLKTEAEGYDFKLWYNPESVDHFGMAGNVDEEVEEKENLYSKQVTRQYEKGGTRKKDYRFKASFNWIGVSIPPDFGGAVIRHSPIPHHLQYDDLVFRNNKERIQWNMLNQSCDQSFDVDDDSRWFTFYAQPEENLLHGDFQGKIVYYDDFRKEHINIRWETHWRLNRVGEELDEDPNEPLPDWNEPSIPPAPEIPEEQPEEEPEPTETFASAYDPETGITTESRRNSDGSRTVTRTDQNGNVISQERKPPAGESLPSASSTNPDTGVTTSVNRNPDGSRTIRQTDSSGNVLNERTIGSGRG